MCVLLVSYLPLTFFYACFELDAVRSTTMSKKNGQKGRQTGRQTGRRAGGSEHSNGSSSKERAASRSAEGSVAPSSSRGRRQRARAASLMSLAVPIDTPVRPLQ